MAALLAKLQNVLPFLLFAVLAVAGVATTTENPASGIFIAMLVIALLGAVAILFQKFLFQKVMKSRNSYQINLQPGAKSGGGIDNSGFDVEKGGKEATEKSGDKLAGNYVPYGQYPAVTADKKEEVAGEGRQEEKWKANYVPYQEDNKEEKE